MSLYSAYIYIIHIYFFIPQHLPWHFLIPPLFWFFLRHPLFRSRNFRRPANELRGDWFNLSCEHSLTERTLVTGREGVISLGDAPNSDRGIGEGVTPNSDWGLRGCIEFWLWFWPTKRRARSVIYFTVEHYLIALKYF